MNTSCCKRSCALLLGLFCLQQIGSAAGVVTNCDETTLRAAMVGGGTVTFACDGTITLTSTATITNNATLDATGRAVIISGGSAVRLFTVESNVAFSLKNLRLADGLAQGTNGAATMVGGPGQGGAVYNDNGLFSAINCSFVHNVAAGGNGGTNSGALPPPPGKGGTGTGGAIYNQNGQVSLTNCNLNDNRALGGTGGFSASSVSTGGDSAGGAIYSTGGQVLLMNCLVNSNRSFSGHGVRFGTPFATSGLASGGGIEIGGGELRLLVSVLTDNWSQAEYITGARGGAITQTGGFLGASDCLFCENSVAGGLGLGIATPSGQPGGPALGGGLSLVSGNANVTNSTFAFNRVEGGSQTIGNTPGAGAGGAAYSLGNLQLLNCTIFGNTAQAGYNGSSGIQGGAFGGGFYNNGGTISLVNTTLADNAAIPDGTNGSSSAVAQGGGVYSVNGTASLLNTIVANSLSGSNGFGSIQDGGHNLSSDSSCNFTNTGSLNNTDPKLGPFDNYGGPTPTMVLLGGSPAIDGGDNGNFPPTDQRGHSRPFGAAPDIGAFESSEPFLIRGKISGATFAEENLVQAGAFSTTSTNRGFYGLEGLSANTYFVTPSTATYLIVPSNRLVTVGPDQLNVDFKAYRWNALSPEGVSNGVLHLAYAGTNGQSFRMLASSNLINWVAISTNVVPVTNLFDIFESIDQPLRFYRTATQ